MKKGTSRMFGKRAKHSFLAALVAVVGVLGITAGIYALNFIKHNTFAAELGDWRTDDDAPAGLNIASAKFVNTSNKQVATEASPIGYQGKAALLMEWEYSGDISNNATVSFNVFKENNAYKPYDEAWANDEYYSKATNGLPTITIPNQSKTDLKDLDGNTIGQWAISGRVVTFYFNDQAAALAQDGKLSGMIKTNPMVAFNTVARTKMVFPVTVGNYIFTAAIAGKTSTGVMALGEYASPSISIGSYTDKTASLDFYPNLAMQENLYRNYFEGQNVFPASSKVTELFEEVRAYDVTGVTSYNPSGRFTNLAGFDGPIDSNGTTRYVSGNGYNKSYASLFTVIKQTEGQTLEEFREKVKEKELSRGVYLMPSETNPGHYDAYVMAYYGNFPNEKLKTTASEVTANVSTSPILGTREESSVKAITEINTGAWSDLDGQYVQNMFNVNIAFDSVSNTTVKKLGYTLSMVDASGKTVELSNSQNLSVTPATAYVPKKNAIEIQVTEEAAKTNLTGATFELQRLNQNTWETMNITPSVEGNIVTFPNLTSGTKYRVVQTGYPEHFIEGSAKIYTNSNKTTLQSEDGVTMTDDGLVLYVTNKKETHTATFKAGTSGTFEDIVVTYDYGSTVNSPDPSLLTAKNGWVFKGWDATLANSITSDVTYTATYNREVKKLDVSLKWIDANDFDGLRKDVKVGIKNEQTNEITEVTLSSSNNYRVVLDLPTYSEDGNTKYSYTNAPVSIANYDVEKTTSSETQIVFTAKHEPVTDITVSKVWSDKDNVDGVRPSSHEITLLADGEATSNKFDTIANSSATFSSLPVFKDIDTNPTAIDYTISEPSVAEYTTKDAKITKSADGVVSAISSESVHYTYSKNDDPIVIDFGEDFMREENEPGVYVKPADENNPSFVGNEDGSKRISIGEDGSIDLGEIEFTKPGTYDYIVTPDLKNDREDQYDIPEITIRYIVTENEETGELDIERVILVDGKEVDPENDGSVSIPAVREDAEPATEELSISLNLGNPSYDGDSAISGIKLVPSEGSNGNPMPSDNQDGSKVYTADENDNYNFGDLTFDKPGETYTYDITPVFPNGHEDQYNIPDIKLVVETSLDEDANEVIVDIKIVVTNEDGTTTEYDPSTPIEAIINREEPAAAEENPVIEGLDMSDIFGDEKPYIKIQPVGDAPMPSDNQDGSKVYPANPDGSFDLGSINFDEEGEYVYKILPSTEDGDTDAFTGSDIELVAKVTRDEDTNELVVEYIYRVDGEEFDSLEDAIDSIHLAKVIPPYTQDEIVKIAALTGATSVTVIAGITIARKRR